MQRPPAAIERLFVPRVAALPARARRALLLAATDEAARWPVLASALEDRWRIVCPDVAGRGQSDRLTRVED
jgi:hypothetical protein